MTEPANDSCDPLTDGLMGDFLDESTDLMRRLNEGMLQIDQAVKCGESPVVTDEELLNSIFRAAHSLKGLSGMMGLQNINALTHKVENVFDAVRVGRLAVSRDVVDVSFQAIDRLDAMIDLLKGSEGGEVECQAVIDRIEQVLLTGTAGADGKSSQNRNATIAVHGSGSLTAIVDPLAGIQDDSDVPAKYLSIFIDESDMTLDTLSDVLLQGVDLAAVESMLVCCHRIKGSAASIGLRRVARLAHLMEDQLQDLRRREATPTLELVDALLKSVDAIRGYVNNLRSGVAIEDGLSDACRQMTLTSAPNQDPAAFGPGDVSQQTQENARIHFRAAIAAAPRGSAGYVGLVEFETGLALVELKARLLLEKLHRAGAVFYSAPAEDELESVQNLTQLVFGVVTDAGQDTLNAELRISGISAVELVALEPNATNDGTQTTEPGPVESLPDQTDSEPTVGDVEGPPKRADRGTGPLATAIDSRTKPAETLRVDIERLDQLMSLAGQLVITKARFSQIGQKLKRLFSVKLIANSLSDASKQAERLTHEIRDWKGNRSPERELLLANAQQIQEGLGVAQRDLGRFTEVRSLLTDLSEAVHQLDRVSDGIQA